MKGLCGFIGWIVGMFLGFALMESAPLLSLICIVGGIPLGYYIASLIEEAREEEARCRYEEERRRIREENERNLKDSKRQKVLIFVKKYPEATKYYFKYHWNIQKTCIYDHDITEDKVDVLLSHEDSYEKDEQKYNIAYRRKIEAEKEAKRKAEQEAAERKRKAEEQERLRREAEIRNLINTLPTCVSSWETHKNSSIKHKYFYEYYPYHLYKDNATQSIRNAWKIVWNFKNDPNKNVSSWEHKESLQTVICLVKNLLQSTFGSKTQYLTFVCLTASTQQKTEARYKEFSEIICNDLNMGNAFSYIRVIEDGNSKHDGGTGTRRVTYDNYFFRGKYVVLFDDVRTTGISLEREKQILEELGAKVICAITIAQTKH